jgi:hypothetical protein
VKVTTTATLPFPGKTEEPRVGPIWIAISVRSTGIASGQDSRDTPGAHVVVASRKRTLLAVALALRYVANGI